MAKVAQHMSRIIAIGTLKDYKYTTEPFVKGQGNIDCGHGSMARFTLFNNDKPEAKAPHTKALDFNKQFKAGDLVYVTGQDNRSPAENDKIYEDISTWDYRVANDDEQPRCVFVYIADIKSIDDNGMVLSFINFKKKEIEFPITFTSSSKLPVLMEVGDRVKVKGVIFSGREEDFYGDGEFVTKRTAVEVTIVNSKQEIEDASAEKDGEINENKLWD